MSIHQEKYELICETLKSRFGWARVIADGVERQQPFLPHHRLDRLYCLTTTADMVGLVLVWGADQFSIDLLCEFNRTEEFVLKQCALIDERCRARMMAEHP